MTPNELRRKFLDFFVNQNHAEIPSAPMVPQNDPTTLFTGSGMQPLVPYLLGEEHPEGNRLVNSQKSFRAEDIEEVGDNRHTTFFEMLGNWSLGDYFKKEQLNWFFSFLVDEVGLDPNKLYVTVFSGDEENSIPRDEDAVGIWKDIFKTKDVKAKAVELLTEEQGGEQGMQGGRIFYYAAKKNWWSRAGVPSNMPVGEPGGPDSEVFYEFTSIEHDKSFGEHCHPNCDCGRFLEIGNSVFMEYKKTDKGFEKLPQQNVDFGGGFERILAAMVDDPDVFNTPLFKPVIDKLEALSDESYQGQSQASMRVIADHLRGSMFMIAEGVEPSNKQQGYVLRRLLRRAVRHGKLLGLDKPFLSELITPLIKQYIDAYPEIKQNQDQIKRIILGEEKRFHQTLNKGLREFEKAPPITKDVKGLKVKKSEKDSHYLSPELAFKLYETFGFPLEMSVEEAESQGIVVPENIQELFDKQRKQHAEKSRSAAKGMFKGGLADHSEATTKLHTATHLLHKALRDTLGDHVRQEGSHITAERLRFDFQHGERLTDEQIKTIEQEINQHIQTNLPVTKSIEDKDEALKSGAMAFFKEKYPDKVSVYTIGDPTNFYSKEFCGGPHVSSTGEIGAVTIVKQESIGSGKRRIYAKLVN